MSGDDREATWEATKVLFAKVLGPSRGEPNTYPAHCKPELKQLIDEVLRRDPNAKPKYWKRNALVEYLLKKDPGLTGDEIAEADSILNPDYKFEEPRVRRAFVLWRAFAFIARTRLCALVERVSVRKR